MENSQNEQTAAARRKFLGWSAGGIAAVAGVSALGWKLSRPNVQGVQSTAASLPALPPLPPPLPTHEEFAAQMHSKFSVSAAGAPAETLELTTISEVKTLSAGNRQFKTFSLIFTGPAAEKREQNIYTVHHDKLGTLDLFLVPVGKPKGNLAFYECVFTTFI